MTVKKKLFALPAVGAAVVGVGIAFAAWTSNATGSGTAQSTTSQDSTITAAASAPDLYPGAVKTVTVTIDNPNDYPVVVNSISAGSAPVINSTCAAGTVTSDERANDPTGLSQTGGEKIITGGGTGTYELTTRMAGAAVDACKSQTFTLPLTATLSSAAA